MSAGFPKPVLSIPFHYVGYFLPSAFAPRPASHQILVLAPWTLLAVYLGGRGRARVEASAGCLMPGTQRHSLYPQAQWGSSVAVVFPQVRDKSEMSPQKLEVLECFLPLSMGWEGGCKARYEGQWAQRGRHNQGSWEATEVESGWPLRSVRTASSCSERMRPIRSAFKLMEPGLPRRRRCCHDTSLKLMRSIN